MGSSLGRLAHHVGGRAVWGRPPACVGEAAGCGSLCLLHVQLLQLLALQGIPPPQPPSAREMLRGRPWVPQLFQC